MGSYDVIVIGAGIIGSATAYTLAKQGKKTLLIEQFPLPHTRGSSHGPSRVTRESYRQTYNARIMSVAYPMWAALAKEAGMELYKETGMLCTTSNERDTLLKYYRTIRKPEGMDEVPMLDSDGLSRNYPIMSFPPTEIGCLDHFAGTLYADKCLQAFQRVFLSKGGVINDNCKAIGITPGDTVTVHTDRGDYQAKGVVLTCGPWASQILEKLDIFLPLETRVIQVCYFKAKKGADHSKLPSFITFFSDTDIYGLPPSEYNDMMKICLHSGVLCDPDMRDMVDAEEEAKDLRKLKQYVAIVFPNLIPEPAIKERCMYTCTPDLVSVIDQHPKYNNIAYGAGFSGHGFKLAPVVGTMLADLVQNKGIPELLVSELRAARFLNKSKL